MDELLLAADWLDHPRVAPEPAQRPEYASPGALAAALDPRNTVETPALELLDRELVDVADGVTSRFMYFMPPQEGKLVADDTPVPTPTGWITHGRLRVGDLVLHPGGRPVRVTAVHAPAEATMVVHTTDHGAVAVHPRHEWTVWDRSRSAWRTVETRYLTTQALSSGQPGQRGHRYRFQLPFHEPLELADAELPVDPYTLGVWLGDGTTTKAAITHHPDDSYLLPYPESARCVHADTGIVTTYYAGGLRADLRAAGVLGNKHIPVVYLRASEKQRRALLAGLIDTDGHVAKTGQVSFDNANEYLVRGTAELIRTLGYRAHVHRPTGPKLSTSGIQGVQPMWRVTYTPYDEGPARLPRKAAAKVGIRRRVAISAVTECAPVPGRCITVDSPDGLYLVGEQFTPTHNSQRVSRWFPLWMLLRNPDLRIVIASYELRSARRWGRAIRNEIKSHPELGLRVKQDTSAAHEWELEGHRGGVYCVGVGGALTGRPADLVIIDDPVKGRKEADSEVYREGQKDWWQETLNARLGETTPVVLIMTRWHEDDLAGWLQAEHPDTWRVVNVPALADHDPAKGETDPLGREPGEWLISARGRTVAGWQERRRNFGARGFEALCQGHPGPADGTVFKLGWWRFYTAPQWVEQDDSTMRTAGFDELIQSWDMAFKATTDTDYVVGQVWARRGANAYLLDQVRDRMDFPTTCRAVTVLSVRWPQAHAKLVEEKANGAAVIAQLQNTIPGLIAITPKESKEARASAVSPFAESGNVFLPDVKLAPWVAGFLAECTSFPHGAHDDQVDALSQALDRMLITSKPRVRFM